MNDELRIINNNYEVLKKDHEYLSEDYKRLGVKYRYEREVRVPELEKLVRNYEETLIEFMRIAEEVLEERKVERETQVNGGERNVKQQIESFRSEVNGATKESGVHAR